MSRTRTVVLAALAAVALVGGGAVLGASATNASGGSPTGSDSIDTLAYDTALSALGDDPTGSGSSDGAGGLRGMGGMGGVGDRMGHRPFGGGADRFLHGELVVKDKDGKPVTVAVQRGEVTAVDAGSVTVKSEDGYTRTWALTDDTIYRSFRDKGSKADVKVGTTVRLAGPVTGGNATAKIVGIPPVGAPAGGAPWNRNGSGNGSGGGSSPGGSSPAPAPSTSADPSSSSDPSTSAQPSSTTA